MVGAEVDIPEEVAVGVAEVEVVEAVTIVSSVGNLVIGPETVLMAGGTVVDFHLDLEVEEEVVVVVALIVLEVALLLVVADMEGMIDMEVVVNAIVQGVMVMVAMVGVAVVEVVMIEAVTVMEVVDQLVMTEVLGTVLRHMVEGQVGALPMMIVTSGQDVSTGTAVTSCSVSGRVIYGCRCF